tara:strand:+ start:240 stop:440 length:201 start_codon:yes stop_codon:yes gene_type:complete
MQNQPYHNKGVFTAFVGIIFFLIGLPVIIFVATLGSDWSETFVEMVFPETCAYEDSNHNKVDNCEN